MVSRAFESLELPALFEILRRYIASPLGEWQIERMVAQPLQPSPEAAEEALLLVSEAMDWLRESELPTQPLLRPRFQGLRDMRKAAERLRVEGAVLEPAELYGLLELLDRAEEIRLQFRGDGGRHPMLGRYGERLLEFGPLLRELSGKILPNGELDDNASSALAKIRRQIEQQRQQIQTTLEQFVRTHYQEGILQEDYVTVRNGRLVVPVKANWKWRVAGVIHGASNTGQTVFVEPLETISLNNQLVRMLEEEQREIHRILLAMTARLREHVDGVQEAIVVLAELELLFAKGRFGIEFRCSIPSFSRVPGGRLSLRGARHPLLQDVVRREGRKVVPLSLTLDSEKRVLVISGPNAGGKTLVLKTAGLLALMAQAGLPVPCDEAEFPWFEQVLADIGDSQSIEENLSTFSAHIEQLKVMMAAANSQSLVLIDELAAATDPQEGGALAVAVVEHFLERQAFTLASTHLPALKIYAENTPGVVNAAVGYDEQTFSPTYRLLVGVPGQSAGLAMAQRLGVPESVIARARRVMASREEETAAFLQQLHRRVEEYEAAEKELRRTENELREQERKRDKERDKDQAAKLARLEQRFEELLKRFEQESKALLAKIEERGATRRAAQAEQRRVAQSVREMRAQFESTVDEVLEREPEKPAAAPARIMPIEPGVQVRLAEMGATGRVVRRLPDNRWEVTLGAMRVQVAAEDISDVLPEGPTQAPRARPVYATRDTDFSPNKGGLERAEINVIGKSREEACEAVDKFLDEAVMSDIERVRIIHGHGMQVLRRELWKMFANHVHVARYYQAEQQEGGAGATIVEVRQ